MLDDLRAAFRSLSSAKAVTTLLVVSLALGTGATAAVFGVVHPLLLGAPAGLDDEASLVSIYTREYSGSSYGRSSFPDYLSLQALPELADLAVYDDGSFANASLNDNVRRVRVVATSVNLFRLLALPPAAGRTLQDGDGETSPPGAVVSHALATFLGEADSLPGTQVLLGGVPYTVVGVAPRGFRGLSSARTADVWIPLDPASARDERGVRRFSLIARMRSPIERLQPRLSELARELASAHPETNRGIVNDADAPRTFTAAAYSPRDPDAGSGVRLLAAVVTSAVALLLVSACINAGTLLLSRALARRRELAVKLALGATHRQLVLQLVAESLIISVAGGLVGLLLASWIMTALPALFSPDDAELLPNSVHPVLALLTIGIATLAGLAFGMAPALQASGAAATMALRTDAGGISEQPRGSRVRASLITVQLALSTFLVIGAALLVDSLRHALQGDVGWGTRRFALLSMTNPGGNCNIFDPAPGLRFQQVLPQKLTATPGVEAVAWAAIAPLGRQNVRQYAVAAGARTSDRVDVAVNVVSPEYFGTLDIPLLAGRPFDWHDTATAQPVAIVDELLARRHFGASAVGHAIIDGRGDIVRIVGVVRSARYRTLQDAPQPTVYLPLAQEYQHCGSLFVRTSGDPAAMLPLIAGRVRAIDGAASIERTATLDRHLSQALALDRIATSLVGLCGLIALALAAVGVYGAINDGVSRRTREIGLRMALGAGSSDVVRLVLWHAFIITMTGIGLGISGALAVDRLAASLVRGLPGLEPGVVLQTGGLLALVVATAAIVPLRRALAVEPTIALRHD